MPQPTQPSSGVFTHRHVTVTFKDGTGTPITRTLGPGPGNIKFEIGRAHV